MRSGGTKASVWYHTVGIAGTRDWPYPRSRVPAFTFGGGGAAGGAGGGVAGAGDGDFLLWAANDDIDSFFHFPAE